MKVRRTLALLGPLTAVAALLLPWYYDARWNGSGYDSLPVRGWDLLTGMNWLLLGIVLAVAFPVVRSRSSVARAAAVAGGSALAVVALRCLFVPWAHAGLLAGENRGAGPWVVLVAGLATIAAGRALHERPDDVATVRRMVALLGPLAAVSALCLPWLAYFDVGLPFPPANAEMGPWIERGWDEFTAFDALLVAFDGVAAAAAIAARRDVARVACVLCGIALAVLAVVSLSMQGDTNWHDTLVLSGPLAMLAAGVITALGGFHLYAPRRIASSLTTAS